MMPDFDSAFIAAFVALIIFFLTLWLSSIKSTGKKLGIAAVSIAIVMGLLAFSAVRYGFDSVILGINTRSEGEQHAASEATNVPIDGAGDDETDDSNSFPYDSGNQGISAGSNVGSKDISEEKTDYLLSILNPYEKPYWYNAEGNISMGGQTYTHGFTCMGYEDSKEGNVTYFNLGGQFTELAFTAGIVSINESENNVTFTFYADENIIDNFEMKKGDLPKSRSVDVTGCNQLKIVVNDGYWVANGSGTYGIADIQVTYNTLGAVSEKKDKELGDGQVYLVDVIEPYEKPYWYNTEGNISMGGQTYTHGFTCMGYEDSKEGNVTYFNLGGQFTELAFTAGIVSINESENNVTFTFYADENIIDNFEMKKGDLPKSRSVDVTGCNQLKIVVNDGYWVANGSGTYGIVNMIVGRK